ncbi:MAG: hypothetical protein PVI86_13085 [Phycisphaerae bacterium]|jgi:hypothetical protein
MSGSLNPNWTRAVPALVIVAFLMAGYSTPVAGAPPMPKIAAWVEVNSRSNTAIENATNGIRAWGQSGAVDAVIISTVPGSESLFTLFYAVCAEAGVTLVPGIKTERAMPLVTGRDGKVYRKLDDYRAWTTISYAVALASNNAQSSVVLLENETATKGHTLGQIEFDPAQWSKAIRQLPQGVQVLWYPTVTSSEPDRRLRQLELLWYVMAEHPDVLLVDNSIDREGSYLSTHGQTNLGYLEALNASFYPDSARPLYRMLYCYGPDSRWWQDDAIVPLIVGPAGEENWVILYPGAERWRKAAEQIGWLLWIATAGSGDGGT